MAECFESMLLVASIPIFETVPFLLTGSIGLPLALGIIKQSSIDILRLTAAKTDSSSKMFTSSSTTTTCRIIGSAPKTAAAALAGSPSAIFFV